jgi:hypothetical protein
MSGYIDEADRATTFILPNNLYTALVGALGSSIKNRAFTTSIGGHLYREIAVDSMQLASLEEVKSFFDICDFKIPYDIKIVDFIDSGVMGSIDDDLILLSSRTFGKGKQYVANTIIEEYIHIKHQVSDKSRAFQEVTIDELINYMKKQNAIIL